LLDPTEILPTRTRTAAGMVGPPKRAAFLRQTEPLPNDIS